MLRLRRGGTHTPRFCAMQPQPSLAGFGSPHGLACGGLVGAVWWVEDMSGGWKTELRLGGLVVGPWLGGFLRARFCCSRGPGRSGMACSWRLVELVLADEMAYERRATLLSHHSMSSCALAIELGLAGIANLRTAQIDSFCSSFFWWSKCGAFYSAFFIYGARPSGVCCTPFVCSLICLVAGESACGWCAFTCYHSPRNAKCSSS